MRKSALLLVSAVVSLFLVACSGDDDGATGSQASAQSAVERCSGAFQCSGPSGTTETRLERRDNACHAGAVRLDPGGLAVAENITATWTETSNGFDICVGGECLRCASTDPAPEATTGK